jgi:NDP-sugar pyrophosphorylase family protein
MTSPNKAMILAAGLGTRLRPLTDHRPKALVEVAGRTLLDLALARLRQFGIHDVIINVHHFADQVTDYLRAHHSFGMRIEISREDVLLDTGGGLKKAAWFFLENSRRPNSPNPATDDVPFILHNVDVLSTIDLNRMLEFHALHRALATLAVQSRPSSRSLLFNEHHQLCGRRSANNSPDPTMTVGVPELVRPCAAPQPRAFAGIHVISPRLLPQLTEDGAFSIITSYLRLAAQGEPILAFPADQYYWRDLGRPENIAQAAADLERKILIPGHIP